MSAEQCRRGVGGEGCDGVALGTRLGEDRDDVGRVRTSSVSRGQVTSMASWTRMMSKIPAIPWTSTMLAMRAVPVVAVPTEKV